MSVTYCVYTQKEHEANAALVAEEWKYWTKGTPEDVATAAVYGVIARCTAVVHFVQWTITESLILAPKMIALGINLLSSEDAAITKHFYQKVSAVYWKVIRATLDQALLLAGAIIAPEVLYGNLQLHRLLFPMELSAFIASMPGLSHVGRNMLFEYPEFIDLVRLWNVLGIDHACWKKDVEQKILHVFETKQAIGSSLLNPESDLFKHLLFTETVSSLSKELNRLGDRLTEEHLRKVTPFTCNCLFNLLTPATQRTVLERAPHLKEAFENPAVEVINTTEAYMGCRFLSLHTFQLNQLFLERMKLARDGLLKLNLYTVDDIESFDDGAYTAIIYLAICYLVDGAVPIENNGLRFTAASGLQIDLTNDQQFFGARECFVHLKQMFSQHDKNQTEALLEHLRTGSIEEDEEQQVIDCFRLICRCKLDIIDTKVMSLNGLRDQDKTAWRDVFTV